MTLQALEATDRLAAMRCPDCGAKMRPVMRPVLAPHGAFTGSYVCPCGKLVRV